VLPQPGPSSDQRPASARQIPATFVHRPALIVAASDVHCLHQPGLHPKLHDTSSEPLSTLRPRHTAGEASEDRGSAKDDGRDADSEAGEAIGRIATTSESHQRIRTLPAALLGSPPAIVLTAVVDVRYHNNHRWLLPYALRSTPVIHSEHKPYHSALRLHRLTLHGGVGGVGECRDAGGVRRTTMDGGVSATLRQIGSGRRSRPSQFLLRDAAEVSTSLSARG
jgi:hypothetical protein